jgi:hypothetical protein
LFFNFALLFDFGCFSLAQEMSFVDYYLPYFRQQLITSLLLALLLFQPLFTKSSCRDQLLTSPRLLYCAFSIPPLLLSVSFQFLVYCSVLFYFLWGGVSLPRGLYWFSARVAGVNTA